MQRNLDLFSTPRSRRWSPNESFRRHGEFAYRAIGSVRFILVLSVVCALWIVWIAAGLRSGASLEAAPALLGLVLVLSIEASYTAPLILASEFQESDRSRQQTVDRRAEIATTQATFSFWQWNSQICTTHSAKLRPKHQSGAI